jgi:ABC-type Zn uptake system ZnuABC Zn-binding protein ZnuA
VNAPPADEPITLPANYARYCATLATELTRRVPALAGPSVARLAAIRERASAEEKKLRAAARPLQGMRVAAATFQADFLRWLGLEVVAVVPPDEDPPPRTLMAVISAGREHGARLVVGNEQNGRRVPTAIAAALGVPPVMLSNFPVRATEGAYEQLLENNLQLLLAGAARSGAPVVTGAVRR